MKHILSKYKYPLIAMAFLIISMAFYFSKFNNGLSDGQETWGQFGDFVGGVLNPLFSLIVIWILIEDLGLSREELQLSIKEQKNATEAMTAQVILMTPKPELIIYPFRRDSIWKDVGLVYEYYVVIENIGKKSAEEINLSMKLLNQNNKVIPLNLSILAPSQKHYFYLGVVPKEIRTEEVLSFSTEVQISFSNTTGDERKRLDLTLIIGDESFENGLLK